MRKGKDGITRMGDELRERTGVASMNRRMYKQTDDPRCGNMKCGICRECTHKK